MTSQTRLDVVVVGAFGVDTCVYLPEPQIDLDLDGSFCSVVYSLGQAGGYQSRGFARLGYHTGAIGFVGDDPWGQLVRDELALANIDPVLLFRARHGTSRSVNLVFPDGSRRAFYDGRGVMDHRADVEACGRILTGCRLIHVNIVNWARDLLEPARAAGVFVSVDLQDVIDPDDEYRRDFIVNSDAIFFSAANLDDPHDAMNQTVVQLRPGPRATRSCSAARAAVRAPHMRSQIRRDERRRRSPLERSKR